MKKRTRRKPAGSPPKHSAKTKKTASTSTLGLQHFPFLAMGSPCEIQLFADNEQTARRIADSAIQDVLNLEQRYSRYRPDSLLSQINQVAASGGQIEVDAETAGLLNYAETCYQQSDGLFDITSGLLRRVWNFKENKIPSQADIDGLLPLIGWHKLRWNPPYLEFPIAGMEIDFGGIVKEYAADRAAALCRQSGIAHGIVNLGGDVSIIGPRADRQPWRIGIGHPRQNDALLTTLSLRQGAVASSGDYQRCIVIDGIHYSHILNPKTGWPSRHLACVSVVDDLCVVAGSASTIAMLKEEQGIAWLESLKLPYLWVDHQGQRGGSLGKR